MKAIHHFFLFILPLFELELFYSVFASSMINNWYKTNIWYFILKIYNSWTMIYHQEHDKHFIITMLHSYILNIPHYIWILTRNSADI